MKKQLQNSKVEIRKNYNAVARIWISFRRPRARERRSREVIEPDSSRSV
jgi:hypothetical protein